MFESNSAAQTGAPRVNIKVLGVGGSGCNAVNTMIRAGMTGVEFITANTDKQALEVSLAPVKVPIGQELTKGLGAGANPEVGRNAALEDTSRISEVLAGADLVFITAGMGGGTGTGAAPVIAKLAKEMGALSVGVVAKPFQFEGKKRLKTAEQGIQNLREHVDLLIIIPNQRLLSLSGEPLPMVEAFKKADEVLLNAVQSIADLITQTGLINSDFAHVKTIMQNKGLALMGLGMGDGEHRAVLAAKSAISSPLLEDISIAGATGVIINITAGISLSIQEMDQATSLIMEAVHEDAEIIFGTVIDESLGNKIKVTVVATGLGQEREGVKAAQPAATAAIPVAAKVSVKTPSPSVAQTAAQSPKQPLARPAVQATAQAPGQKQPLAPASGATSTDRGALSRARGIGEKLGITDFTDNPLNIPSYIKRPPGRDA